MGLVSKVRHLRGCLRSVRLSRGQAEGRVQRDDEVDRRILLPLGGDGGFDGRHVLAVDVELLGGARESLGNPGATRLQRDVALLVDDAQHLLAPSAGQPFSCGSPGQSLSS